eukprot:11227150-Lingulodinium_polyedra.AAC.1
MGRTPAGLQHANTNSPSLEAGPIARLRRRRTGSQKHPPPFRREIQDTPRQGPTRALALKAGSP